MTLALPSPNYITDQHIKVSQVEQWSALSTRRAVSAQGETFGGIPFEDSSSKMHQLSEMGVGFGYRYCFASKSGSYRCSPPVLVSRTSANDKDSRLPLHER